MATSLQVTMASLFPSASSLSTRRRSVCCAAKFPMPPLNPKDPFLSRLSRVAAEAPDRLINGPNDGPFPHLDVLESPQLRASPYAAPYRSRSRSGNRARTPPPDLPSMLLDARIVYIGMPLVPEVSELIVAELVYLAWEGSIDPIYLYINSTGTCLEDGVRVANEGHGFAIYDVLMELAKYVEIKTVCMGVAMGHAALLLAAGTKGHRFMLQRARATLTEPEYDSTGWMPATDIQIHAREVKFNRDTFARLLAKHTGNSDEFIFNAMKNRYSMNPRQAIEFGLIDKEARSLGKLNLHPSLTKKQASKPKKRKMKMQITTTTLISEVDRRNAVSFDDIGDLGFGQSMEEKQ